jgi:hypothetical protein
MFTRSVCPGLPVDGESLVTTGLGFPTMNELLVPEAPPPTLAATIVKVPVFWNATVYDERTPDTKRGVRPAPMERSPVELITIPSANDVTAFSYASSALNLILKGTPTYWVSILPPPSDSTANLETGPGVLVR